MIQLEHNQTTCCGLCEIHTIDQHVYVGGSRQPEPTGNELLFALGVAKQFKGDNEAVHGPFVVFSSITNRGETLARAITRNKVGSVVRSKKVRNPNSNNLLQVFVANLDRSKLLAFMEKEFPDNFKKDCR